MGQPIDLQLLDLAQQRLDRRSPQSLCQVSRRARKEAAKGFQRIRPHDLRHMFGRRLRAAGVSLEDRQDLLGHESGRVTTHDSSAEVANLVKAANVLTEFRQSSTRTVLRLISNA